MHWPPYLVRHIRQVSAVEEIGRDLLSYHYRFGHPAVGADVRGATATSKSWLQISVFVKTFIRNGTCGILRTFACASATTALMLMGLSSCAQAAPPATDSATPRACPSGAVTVAGADQRDFEDVCHGAAAAIAFFSAHGAATTEVISIEVNPRIPADAGPSAAGCYIEHKRKAYLLPYAAFKKNKTWFGVAISRSTYRALATHEAAHAIAACLFRVSHPTIQAKEYLAYVAMWSGMEPVLRNKALRTMHTVGLNSLDRFTPLLYMFDPMRFGAEAYLHFTTAPEQTALIHTILSGTALTD